MKTVACVAAHVHDPLERAKLRPVVGARVATRLGGFTAAGSVVLAPILRSQAGRDERANRRIQEAQR